MRLFQPESPMMTFEQWAAAHPARVVKEPPAHYRGKSYCYADAETERNYIELVDCVAAEVVMCDDTYYVIYAS